MYRKAIQLNLCVCVLLSVSHVQLFATPWTVACQAPLSMSVHEISQVRILEWVAISFSRGSSQLRDRIHVSCIGGQILYHWATCEAHVCVHICVCVCICIYAHIYIFLFQILFHYRLSASLSAWHSACPQSALDTRGLGGSPTWCGSGTRRVTEEGRVLHSLQAAGAAPALGQERLPAVWRMERPLEAGRGRNGASLSGWRTLGSPGLRGALI